MADKGQSKPPAREGMREYRAEDVADKEQADALTAEADRDVPRTADQIVDDARLNASLLGKPLMAEQIQILDDLIAQRYSSARANATTYGPAAWDWDTWGRKTFVLESVEAFLKLLDADPEARDSLTKKFRRR